MSAQTIGTKVSAVWRWEANSANILSVLGDAVWPGIGGKILVVAVALSTVATLETTLIQVTRTLFSMGRDHTIPSAFGLTVSTNREAGYHLSRSAAKTMHR